MNYSQTFPQLYPDDLIYVAMFLEETWNELGLHKKLQRISQKTAKIVSLNVLKQSYCSLKYLTN